MFQLVFLFGGVEENGENAELAPGSLGTAENEWVISQREMVHKIRSEEIFIMMLYLKSIYARSIKIRNVR